jgi:hypothetical protein
MLLIVQKWYLLVVVHVGGSNLSVTSADEFRYCEELVCQMADPIQFWSVAMTRQTAISSLGLRVFRNAVL